MSRDFIGNVPEFNKGPFTRSHLRASRAISGRPHIPTIGELEAAAKPLGRPEAPSQLRRISRRTGLTALALSAALGVGIVADRAFDLYSRNDVTCTSATTIEPFKGTIGEHAAEITSDDKDIRPAVNAIMQLNGISDPRTVNLTEITVPVSCG